MSSDTAKENASVVDSSVTEWKHYMGDFDNQESPSYKGNEDAYRSGAEEHGHFCDQVENSSAIKGGKYKTRYFIIKSLNHQNIQLSIEKGIWATQVMNEPILEEAFHNSGKVILIYSVNMSGFFQGYAQMISSVGWRRDSVWSQGSGGSNPWGRSFRVKWLRLCDLPFQKTLHLKNPLNDYKPVKISRDCQELPQDIGEALCELLDMEMDVNDKQRRAPMFYPSLHYQHHAEVSKFHSVQQRPTEIFLPENSPVTSGALEDTLSKHSCIKRSLPNVHVDHDSSRFNHWHLPMERSPVASAVTEDDILEMTYEEYLEAHSRSIRSSHLPVAGPSWRIQESSVAKEYDDWYTSCLSNKRTHRQSLK